MKINLHQSLRMLAKAIDLINPVLASHHERTASLFTQIATAAGLAKPQRRTGFIVAMLHDVGGLSEAARLASLSIQDSCLNTHAHIGSKLLSRISWLNPVSNVVYHHHTPWRSRTSMLPSESHMLYLADRVDVMLIAFSHDHKDYLQAAEKVREAVKKQRAKRFAPSAVDAFLAISQPASFWLALESPWLDQTLDRLPPVMNESISLTGFRQLSQLLAFIIDIHSRDNARHSRHVGLVAFRLGRVLGYNSINCMKLEIAGLLHDIGKLAISLSSPDREHIAIQRHSWITTQLLSSVADAEDIALWAGSHHENTSGTGYPYGIAADKMPEACRIATAADIWVSLTENRPSRRYYPS